MSNDPEIQQRILVIDDDPETVDILNRLLSRHNYEVEEFVDPRRALKVIENGSIAVVLSDVHMPEMNGHDITRAVLETNSGTQVILMTAYTSMDKVLDAYRIGVSDYLLKPFGSLDEVVEAVALGVNRYSRWQQVLQDTF